MPQPWERQPEETNKAWAAFRIYRDLDAMERSTERVRKVIGCNTARHLETWSSQYNWVARAGAYDAHVDELKRNQRERERLAASERRIQLAKNMQLVGGAKIQEIGKKIQDALSKGEALPAISLKDAAALIDAGVKLERLEAGLTTGNTGLTGADGGPVKVVHTYMLVDGVKPMKEIPAPQEAAITESAGRSLRFKRKEPENDVGVNEPADPPRGSSQERKSP